MPELPEVETVRRSLLPLLTGWTITAVSSLTLGVLSIDPSLTLTGLTIKTIRRRGKYLLFDLIPGAVCMVVHLRMTGQFHYLDQPPILQKHDHVLLALERAGSLAWLVYHDTRRFGRIQVLPAGEIGRLSGLAVLGPEPLVDSFNGDLLARRLARRQKTSLKAALLDQTVLAGLGNIYADESLFAAGISPLRRAGSLSPAEADRLADIIRRVLTAAIGCRGTSIRDYVDGLNVRGHFQYQLQVYGRGGQPCLRCGTPLVRRTIAGRTTCSCPVCQPDDPSPSCSPPASD